ncbi:OSCP/delta subunit of ATPase [Lipomyces tetrasporus]|uniref:ATP synthase subunit 5, mitochondrial n=1 Tax=Lipomyces tetrasporus TaxID=54092 RepID=A0AAD7QRB1_9ASCO|nr:OSCP/delta subunit of ATPase [Lipomyces tetrasporus]KAJ8099873.1 OSCP/delta subunit of ATPase [Lipomyces tetrasporus]
MIPTRIILRAVPVSGRTFMRTYATAASTTPPVQLFGVDGTYASALYSAAAKSSSLDDTSKALTSLKTLVEKDADLSEILANPALSASDKKIVVETLSKSVSAPTVANLLAVLAENNRLGLLSEIIEKFGTLMSAYKGEVEATITSATPLDSKVLSRIESAIAKSQFVGNGKKLKVSNKVNPDILGGLIVEVGDRTVDLSMSSKISRLNALINEAV